MCSPIILQMTPPTHWGYCLARTRSPGYVSANSFEDKDQDKSSRKCLQQIDQSELQFTRRGDSGDGLAMEGTVRLVPRLARSQPSDRAARRKALEGRLRAARERAATEAAVPLVHGRCCLAGLMILEMLRVGAWWQGTTPGSSVIGMHFLTTTSDVACILCAMPLFAAGTQGQCVIFGCLGPMLTLVFAMSLVDMSALGAYLVVATPRPLPPGAKSPVDALEACIGVWEFALIASVALQMALCTSSWRIYRELRMAGLYPPGTDPASVAKMRNVSLLEVMCEAEDVELLADCEMNCDSSMKRPLIAYPCHSTGDKPPSTVRSLASDAAELTQTPLLVNVEERSGTDHDAHVGTQDAPKLASVQTNRTLGSAPQLCTEYGDSPSPAKRSDSDSDDCGAQAPSVRPVACAKGGGGVIGISEPSSSHQDHGFFPETEGTCAPSGGANDEDRNRLGPGR